MNELRRLGVELREVLAGLLTAPTPEGLGQGVAALRAPTPERSRQKTEWARVLETCGLPEHFKGETDDPVRGVIPPPAIHHVRIKTEDTFLVPGRGRFTASLEGYSQVVVGKPSTHEWGSSILYVNYTEHKMFGTHPDLGEIMVELNPEVVSGGNIFPTPANGDVVGGERGAMACRVNIAALFHVEELGTPLFNKTPVQIASNDLKGVPPLGEGGRGNVFSLPLYRVDQPNGDLVAYMEALQYDVMDYAPRELVNRYRAARSVKQFMQVEN